MATPAEAFPDNFDEDELITPEVAAHLGRIPHHLEVDGEEIRYDNPGNFPEVLHAYMLNRFGHEGEGFDIPAYQRTLTEHKIGQFVTAALDVVYAIDRESIIDPALRASKNDPLSRINHEIVIGELTPYLPPDIDPAVLRDLDVPEPDQEAA